MSDGLDDQERDLKRQLALLHAEYTERCQPYLKQLARIQSLRPPDLFLYQRTWFASPLQVKADEVVVVDWAAGEAHVEPADATPAPPPKDEPPCPPL